MLSLIRSSYGTGQTKRRVSASMTSSKLTDSKALNEAIASFLPFAEQEGYDDPDSALGMCNHASDEFLHELTKRRIEGEIEHYEDHILIDQKDYPYGLSDCQFHWAVRVGDWIIDWTARQFDNAAPFPAIWKGQRREWRNCG